MANSVDDLRQKQSLPLELKIEMSKRRIMEWYEHWEGDVYVAFSGGKDSTVLLDIARKLYPNILGVFVDTGLEWPEIKSEIVKKTENIETIRPKIGFKDVIEKYGFPVISKTQAQYIYEYRTTNSEKLKSYRWNGNKNKSYKISEKWKFLVDAPFKISDKCCDIIKKDPNKDFEKRTGLRPILGNMASESNQRQESYVKYGCNAFGLKRETSKPLSFWTEQDILQYIYINKIPLASVYGEIIRDRDGNLSTTKQKRTGCMFCLFGIHLDNIDKNRFHIMKEMHPKHYEYCINKLGIGEVLDFINVKY